MDSILSRSRGSCFPPNAPRSADASPAFFRRWLVVPFNRVFEEGAADTVPSDQPIASLTNPTELSGVLNRAIDALMQLRAEDGFMESTALQSAWQEMRDITDPVATWLDARTQEDPSVVTPKTEIRRAYNADAALLGRPPMTAQGFGRAFRAHRPSIDEAQRTVGGKLVRCHVGIELVDGG